MTGTEPTTTDVICGHVQHAGASGITFVCISVPHAEPRSLANRHYMVRPKELPTGELVGSRVVPIGDNVVTMHGRSRRA